ncbi:hypothetical protein NE555_16165, partial [Alistipes onderdonkii]|uniref:hypothetical protein n=1 Tax=Alistipes onderdonkii TaxID=328813 RepID=UPI00210C747E
HRTPSVKSRSECSFVALAIGASPPTSLIASLTDSPRRIYIDDDEAKEITKEALKAAGLEFRFVLPTKPYKVGDNDTDQQKFASVSNTDGAWTLTSKLPDGTTNNQ